MTFTHTRSNRTTESSRLPNSYRKDNTKIHKYTSCMLKESSSHTWNNDTQWSSKVLIILLPKLQITTTFLYSTRSDLKWERRHSFIEIQREGGGRARCSICHTHEKGKLHMWERKTPCVEVNSHMSWVLSWGSSPTPWIGATWERSHWDHPHHIQTTHVS